jgi:hypothetical protein
MKAWHRVLSIPAFLFTCFSVVAQQDRKSANKNNENYRWEGGITAGNIYIDGDVRPIRTQIGEGLYISKPFTDWFAVRFNYQRGNAKGLNSRYAQNFAKNTAWTNSYAAPVRQSNGSIGYFYNRDGTLVAAPNGDIVYYNHKTSLNFASISTVFTLPIAFKNTEAGLYVFSGAGTIIYKATVDARDKNGTYKNLFNEVISGPYDEKQRIKKLKQGMDGDYERNAEIVGGSALFNILYGAGFSFKIKKRFTVGFERTWYLSKSDLLDGQRWMEYAFGDALMTQDFDKAKMNCLKIGFLF